MSVSTNFVTTNPAQLNDRVTELQIAAQLDEALALETQTIAAAGAIAVAGGVAVLAAGGTSAVALTLANPIAGSQANSGQDGTRLKLVSADAALYTVTLASNAINGNKHIISFGSSTSLEGLGIDLIAYNGIWLTSASATLAGAKADGTVTLQ